MHDRATASVAAPLLQSSRPIRADLQRIMPMPKTFIAIVGLLLTALTISACDNTVRGIGRDARQTGDAIEDSTQ